jgi:hypothetical protein
MKAEQSIVKLPPCPGCGAVISGPADRVEHMRAALGWRPRGKLGRWWCEPCADHIDGMKWEVK